MPFKSESIGRSGTGWSVSVKTVEDLEVGEDVIYAQGICTLYRQQSPRHPRIVTGEHRLDNRCCEIRDSKVCFIRGRQIYRQSDSKSCLQDILQKLILIGSSS